MPPLYPQSVGPRDVLTLFPAFTVGGGPADRSLGGSNTTLTLEDNPFQSIDPEGALDLTLPAEEDAAGAVFFIHNKADAAEAITVKDDGGNTIVTVGQNDTGIVACDGSSWLDMGAPAE